MSLGEVLLQTGAIDSIADELGIDQATARAGAAALLPAITAGVGRKSTEPEGISSLLDGFGGAAGAGVLLDLVLGQEKTPADKGNDILGQIFGNKDVSRSVATEASSSSGVSPDILKKMLPLLAMAAAGYLSKRGAEAKPAEPEPASLDLGGIFGSIVSSLAR